MTRQRVDIGRFSVATGTMKIQGTETGRFKATTGSAKQVVFYSPCCHKELIDPDLGTCPECHELIEPMVCCATCREPLRSCTCL